MESKIETQTDEQKRMKITLEKISKFSKLLTKNNHYHNYPHELEVYHAVTRIGKAEGLSDYQLFILKTGALVHDLYVSPKRKDNEERTVQIVQIYLPEFGYTSEETDATSALVLATKMPQNPTTLMEKVICDADLDNFGREDFMEKGEMIREELGIPRSLKWYEGALELIRNHKYWTEYQRSFRDYGKLTNICKLTELVVGLQCKLDTL